MIVHLVLAAVVAALPLGQWVDRRLTVRGPATGLVLRSPEG
jgi:hypothetical protein